MPAILEAKNLTIGFQASSPVAKNLNFIINPGDFLCIVGPNGSGKTTLIKTLLGLQKPLSGQLHLTPELKHHLGYLPQYSQIDPNFPASVEEIVLSGCQNQLGLRPFYQKTHRLRANKALNQLGLEKLKKRPFSLLSGGQRQRTLLARALCATSKLLILDEPSNSLDFTAKQSLYKTLRTLNRAQNLAIVMVTHDLDHRNLLGDKILALSSDAPKHYFFGSTAKYVELVHHA